MNTNTNFVEIQMPRLSEEALRKFILSKYHAVYVISQDGSSTTIARLLWKSLEEKLEEVFSYSDYLYQNPFGFLSWFIHLQNFTSKEDVLRIVEEIQKEEEVG